MKKYNLLWHLFELEPRAHDFLDSYVQRIETYAHNHHINNDILDDIKYNIIEKLYTAKSPINEAFVMNLAETIGEPEQIFEVREAQDEESETQSNILERWFWKDKPMIWWVAYRIAKSLNIPVAIVRLIFLIAVFIYGTSIWLYPLLALFVPYQDKKKSSGQVGNLFFETIRIIIWLGLIFFLWSTIIGTLIGSTFFLSLPLLSNQSIQSILPTSIYPLGFLSLAALISLFVWSIWALLKKTRLSKTFAMVAIGVILASWVITGMIAYTEAMKYNNTTPTVSESTLNTFTTDSESVIITLNQTGNKTANYFQWWLRSNFKRWGMFQEIKLLPSPNNEISVIITDTMNITDQDKKEHILSQRTSVSTTTSGNEIIFTIPNTIFSQKVPFVFAKRTINIYVPTNKTIQYNNNSEVRYHTPHQRYGESTTTGETRIICNDTKSFKYNEREKERKCANISSELIPLNTDMYWSNNLDEDIDDIFDREHLTNDQEHMIEKTYIWLPLTQATTQATASGMILRVVKEDGIDLPSTEDYRPGRINIEINKGIITDLDIE